MNSAFQNILNIISEASVVAGLVAPFTGPEAAIVAEGSKIAAALENIISNAVAAHQAALGSSIDLTKLAPITPVQ